VSPFNDQYSASAMPPSGTGTGGTIESGTDFMTAITDYEEASGNGTHKDTIVIDAAASTFVTLEVNTGTTKPATAGTFSTLGNKLTLAVACPATATAMLEYTYAAGTLTTYDANSKTVAVFTKQ
jgi:hypothetical protein